MYRIKNSDLWIQNSKFIIQIKFIYIFWEGHKILRNFHRSFVLCSNGQIYGGDFAKFSGLLRICIWTLRNHFPWLICHLLYKDEEHLALRNNFRVTKKFLITKFDCTYIGWNKTEIFFSPKGCKSTEKWYMTNWWLSWNFPEVTQWYCLSKDDFSQNDNKTNIPGIFSCPKMHAA